MAEQITIISPPAQAPAGHDEAMIAKADAAAGITPQADEQRPAWLPEKFKTVEEFAASYTELEKKLGAPKPVEPVAATPAATPAAATDATPAAAGEALKVAGLSMEDFSKEFSETGTLSDASYATLAAKGFDKSVVDTYIAGQKALSTNYDNSILSEVGGAEKYAEITTWAKANMAPEEIDAYNAAVTSGNVAQARLATAGLNARFTAAVGSDPSRLIGGQGNAVAADVFESQAQVTAAMKDPRYAVDPAYRNAIQAKLGRSSVF